MEKAKIFIDEFGNSHLDLSKQGTFSHFVYASIIIPESEVESARTLRKEICKKFRLGNDIKSKNLGDKKYFQKRLDILNYLKENLDFTIDVLVIDKSKLDKDEGGLRFKKTFYKYFQKVLIRKYNQVYSSYNIYLDKLGFDNFRTELVNFIDNYGTQRDLFNPDRTFELSDDKTDEKLVQLADIIAGSLGRLFCLSHYNSESSKIYEILHTRMSVSYYPYLKISNKEVKQTKTLSKEISQLNLESLKNYLELSQKSEDALKRRLLEYLYTNSKIDSERLVPSFELISFLKNFSKTINEDKLRLLIRDLRYEGLFIISHSGKPGYKLASNYSDIEQHFSHFMKYIIPMLNKIKVLNQNISQLSFNKINPLEKDNQFERIKKLIEQL
ncbi:DUF3800 domain-containing protein [Cellulophaga tyrosinoxydans]|uniref:DUF3800 domain-containing protein n=1 Tax=Cellulophaga tyrosinoxydans TaxID=504486 RepID=A0A1W2CHT2_9FLAO|nr:DUF3800 domain-containing protein [Cellulophaga tyrosinoxydans]SMC84763.1 Protein of unknown function [Cellulophaga tyrosinoxydans]